MKKLIKLIGKVGVLVIAALMAPLLLTALIGLLGIGTLTSSTLGLVFLILSPGIVIGLIIGCLSKEKTEEA